MTYKSIMGKLWVSLFCKQADFVVKTDDDIFIDMYELYFFTRGLLVTNTSKLLVCPVMSNVPISRDPTFSHFISEDEIPLSETIFPDFCHGHIYILTTESAGLLAKAAEGKKYFWIDDLWVGGILPKELGFMLQDITNIVEVIPWNFLYQKTIQNVEMFLHDNLAGHIQRNYQMGQALIRKTEWCYKVKCNNSFYNSTST